MKINFSAPISFNSLAMYKLNGAKIPEDFSCRTSDNNRTFYDISIKRCDYIDGFEVRFDDINTFSKIEPIADEEIMIRPEINYMYVDNMFTDDDKRGNGLGTCMHLVNIIEMMENNVDRIELRASSSAVAFHTKLGFKPIGFMDQNSMNANIRAIAEDNTPKLLKHSQDAKALLKSHMSTELRTKLALKLVENYTKDAIKVKNREEQEYLFPNCIEMSLTKKDVLKNKGKYNKLFKKYNIDYEI